MSSTSGSSSAANSDERSSICLQVVEDGYEFFAKRQLVTLFSAPNYCGEFDNAGAMMSVDETLMCSFQVRTNETSASDWLEMHVLSRFWNHRRRKRKHRHCPTIVQSPRHEVAEAMLRAKILCWRMARNRCETVQRTLSIVNLVEIETFTFAALRFSTRTSFFPLPVASTYLTLNNVDIIRPVYIIKISFFALLRTHAYSLSLALRTLTSSPLHSYLFHFVVFFVSCFASSSSSSYLRKLKTSLFHRPPTPAALSRRLFLYFSSCLGPSLPFVPCLMMFNSSARRYRQRKMNVYASIESSSSSSSSSFFFFFIWTTCGQPCFFPSRVCVCVCDFHLRRIKTKRDFSRRSFCLISCDEQASVAIRTLWSLMICCLADTLRVQFKWLMDVILLHRIRFFYPSGCSL